MSTKTRGMESQSATGMMALEKGDLSEIFSSIRVVSQLCSVLSNFDSFHFDEVFIAGVLYKCFDKRMATFHGKKSITSSP